MVAAASALGRPLKGRAGLRHRAPHVEVGRAVAIHFPRVTEASSRSPGVAVAQVHLIRRRGSVVSTHAAQRSSPTAARYTRDKRC